MICTRSFGKPPHILACALLLGAVLLCGCDLVRTFTGAAADERAVAPPDSSAVKRLPTLAMDDDALAGSLHSYVNGLDSTALAHCFHAERLRVFYERRGWQPVWTREDAWPDEAALALETIEHAASYGLNPAAFHADDIRSSLDAAARGDAQAWSRIEWLLSDAAVAYAHSLRYGAVNPRRADPDGYFLPLQQPAPSALIDVLMDARPGAALAQIAPTDARSIALRAAMLRMAGIAWTREFPLVPPPEKVRLAAGDRSRIFRAIALRLALTGDLTGGGLSWTGVRGQEDGLADLSLRIDPARLTRLAPVAYDSALARGLRRFQQRNGLLPDGVVGARTVVMLNRPPAELLRSLATNLERFRWLRYPENGRYVKVNIPEFQLYAYDGDALVTDMKICCGQSRSLYYDSQFSAWQRTGSQRMRPVNFETPQMTGSLRMITVNPVWYVPPIIARKELLYSARKDSTFMRRKKYRIFYHDSLVQPEKINWRAYSEVNLPFRISQDPGELNALGRLKFTFDNPFSIYMHDTPLRMAFNRARRDVSHGCMRLERPLAFVSYLLHGTEGWDAGRVQQLVWQNVHSRPVHITEHPPLFVDYYTAWVDSTGSLQLRDDVYRKDRRIARTAVSPRGIPTLAFSTAAAATAAPAQTAPATAATPVPAAAPTTVKAPAAVPATGVPSAPSRTAASPAAAPPASTAPDASKVPPGNSPAAPPPTGRKAPQTASDGAAATAPQTP